jgi:hypothetical protein
MIILPRQARDKHWERKVEKEKTEEAYRMLVSDRSSSSMSVAHPPNRNGNRRRLSVFKSRFFLLCFICDSRACLSWQKMIVLYHTIKTAQTKEESFSAAAHRMDCTALLRQNANCSSTFFPVCFSRACLGKTIICIDSINMFTAKCIIIAPKRLKLRLSGSARKSQKRFRDTPRFKFQAVWPRTQPFYHAA